MKTKEAEQDFKYLLDRGYTRKSALRLVRGRYQLGEEGKNFLLRKVFSQEEIEEHEKKLIAISEIKGEKIAVDTYNVLITVESILAKEKLVRGMDGLLRDFQGVFSSYKFDPKTNQALEEILKTLQEYSPKFTLFVLDSQISKSGELASYIREQLEKFNLEGDAKTKRSADSFLIEKNFITATSDTVIIEKVDKAIDLAREIWERRK